MSNILSYQSTMQKIILFACTFLTALTMSSCADDVNDPAETTDPEAGYITLELTSTKIGSRGDLDEPGLDPLNENYMGKALICLYPSNAAPATDGPVLMEPVTFSSTTTSTATAKIRINRDLITSLFPTGSTAKAYVIVNLPTTTTIPDDITIDGLKRLTIDSKFGEQVVQNSFVMDGTCDVTLAYDSTNPSKSKVTGKVYLTRAASKINLAVKVAASVEDGNGTTWQSDPNNMTVYFTNGVKNSAVTPSTYTLQPADYYNIPSTSARSFNKSKSETEEYPYELSTPFYTYPNSWNFNDSEETYMTLVLPWKKEDESAYRYCYYTVPVVKGTSIDRNVSYHVNIDVGILGSFTQDIPMQLKELSYCAVEWGSAPVGVDIKDYRYLVLDQTDYVLNNEASINIPFYSTHNTTVTNTKVTYYLYNFSAEGNEEAVEITSDQNINSTTTFVGDALTHIYASTVDNSINPTTSTRTLTFDHPLYQWTPYDLNNNQVVLSGPTYPTASLAYLVGTINRYVRSENQSYSRYDIEITIVHTDKVGKPDANLYTKTIKITQYPGIYIESTKNYYSSTTANNTPQRGNVYVNNNQNVRVSSGANATPGILSWVSVRETNPLNPNMYVLSITNLNDNTYRIGDPRQTEVNNLTYNNNTDGYLTGYLENPTYQNGVSYRWQEAKDLSGTTRRLSFYHPTNTSTTFTYMLAPKLRVSSYYGAGRSVLTRLQAEQRCAGYQEMYFPAGRWRLPTLGELQYIMNLWNDNKIPPLFSATDQNGNPSKYWTAQGLIPTKLTDGKLDSSQLTNGTDVYGYIRCVYDEWYWKDKGTIPSTATNTWDGIEYGTYAFTWGDLNDKK